MRTIELLRFHFGGRPELLFYCSSGIGQLGSGRTADEQALETGANLWFRSSGRIKKKSGGHIIKLKSVNDPRLGGIVGRHLHLYSISDG